MIGYCGHGEARGGLARRDTFYVIGFRIIFCFFVIGLSWKQGQKFGKPAVIDQVLTHKGQLPQKLWFGFLNWPQRLWVRVLLSYIIWPLSICIVSLLGVSVGSGAKRVISVVYQ